MQETAHRTRDADPVDEEGWPLLAGTKALAVEGDLTAARVWFEDAYEAAERICDRRTMAAAALGMGGLWVHEHRSVTVAMTVEQRMRHALSLLDAGSQRRCGCGSGWQEKPVTAAATPPRCWPCSTRPGGRAIRSPLPRR